MRIWEYFTYGLFLAVLGGGGIGGSIASDAGSSLGLWFMLVGVPLAAVGQIFLLIGIVAKGVEVGTRG